MADDIDWKKFGMGLSDAVFGIASVAVTAAGYPMAGPGIAAAGKGVNQVIDAAVPEQGKKTSTPTTPPTTPAPVEGADAQAFYAFLIKKGWPPAFAKQLIEEGPAKGGAKVEEPSKDSAKPTQLASASTGVKESDVAYWRRSLADPKLSPELRDFYSAQLKKAEQKS